MTSDRSQRSIWKQTLKVGCGRFEIQFPSPNGPQRRFFSMNKMDMDTTKDVSIPYPTGTHLWMQKYVLQITVHFSLSFFLSSFFLGEGGTNGQTRLMASSSRASWQRECWWGCHYSEIGGKTQCLMTGEMCFRCSIGWAFSWDRTCVVTFNLVQGVICGLIVLYHRGAPDG